MKYLHNNLYKMCSEINPYKRADIDDILNYINEIMTITLGGCEKCKKKLHLSDGLFKKSEKKVKLNMWEFLTKVLMVYQNI